MKSFSRIVKGWLITTQDIVDNGGKSSKWILSVLVADSLTHEITHKKRAL